MANIDIGSSVGDDEFNDDSIEIELPYPKRSSADVWADFKLVKKAKKVKAKCLHCGILMTGDSKAGTSHLKRHRDACSKRHSVDSKQQTLSFGVQSGASSLSLQRFDMDRTKKLIVKAIIVHELSFRSVEYKYLIKAFESCNPKFASFSRRTLKREIMLFYNSERTRMKKFINDHVQRVSLTFDMWTSQQTLGYLCLTCQYIDDNWKLHSHILSFAHVPPPHNAQSLYESLSECISSWYIQSKIFTISGDNCTTNDSAINTLRMNVGGRNLIPLRRKHFHIRCGAHILNLIVKEGMDDMNEAISKIRESVKYVKGSPKRKHCFYDCAKAMGLNIVKQLSYDVPTRWNSTLFMLQTALLYKDAFEQMAGVDSNYKCLPSEDEWTCASTLCNFLQIFYDATTVFSTTKEVTAHLVFFQVYAIYKHLHEYSVETNQCISSFICKMQDKFDKYWKEYNVMFAIALVLDPRYKLVYVKFLVKSLNELDAIGQFDNIESCLYALYEEYKRMYPVYPVLNDGTSQSVTSHSATTDSTSQSVTSQSAITDALRMVTDDAFKSYYFDSCAIEATRTDLEVYLSDGIYQGRANEEFNILSWWKKNEDKYKILSKMARGILAIPVSTVASESAFSTAGRIVSDYRCSSTPQTIEALICSQSWIRDEDSDLHCISDGESSAEE